LFVTKIKIHIFIFIKIPLQTTLVGNKNKKIPNKKKILEPDYRLFFFAIMSLSTSDASKFTNLKQ
jgi:hypothetical protein